MSDHADGALGTTSSTLTRVREQDPLTLSSSEIRKLAKELAHLGLEPNTRIAFGGNVVFEPVVDFLRVHLACAGLVPEFHIIEFGQVMQTLLDEQCGLHRFKPQCLFLHWELDDFLAGPKLHRRAASPDVWKAEASDILQTVCSTVSAALASTNATILLSNFVEHDRNGLGLAAWRSEFGPQHLCAHLNLSLSQQFRLEPRVQLVDLARLTAEFGRSQARDLRLYLLAKIPWRESFLPSLADELARHVKAALGRIRKCLVVDLDNTLWDGVLGEDGCHGVRVGIGDATSEAHYRLQQRILALKERGVLLAVCSKNDADEVADVFRMRTDMPLQAQDFACMQIGWDPKDQGLRRIAARLNIGLDSLVFLDDNPAEIDWIRNSLPEVECVLLPVDSALRPSCLDRVHSLDRAIITGDDLAKAAQYQQGTLREATRGRFADVQDYLRSLETVLELQPLSRELLARAHQLFMKTNQFNVTGRRYDLGELERCIADPSCIALIARAADRFGDLGWIAAVIVSSSRERSAHIENIVISCRALGRRLEVAIINALKSICFQHHAFECLTAEYRPSKRNAQTSEIFADAGFRRVECDEEAVMRYQLSREQAIHEPCDWISVSAPLCVQQVG